ncbi:MAG: HAD hydrolase-like protein [Spirochaetes bacterium]|nr:HAD hydrolase-like protein [Spirochaetota bacterium]
MKKLIIFDMDGVLIDVSSSYKEAIRKTASIFLLPCINSNLLPQPLFNLQELSFLKGTGGLNNDWDMTHKVVTLMFSKISNRKENTNREKWDVKKLASFLKSEDKPLETLFKEAGTLNFKEVDFFYKGDVGSGNIIKQIFQEIYLGKRLFSEIYGIAPQYCVEKGLILKEKLLINRAQLSSLSAKNTLAVATGRPEKEALYAIKKNNIDFFKKVLTHDDCVKAAEEAEKNTLEKISFCKPHPFMLDVIAEHYKNKGELKEKPYYIGDIPDDMIAAKRSKYNFCAVGVTYSSTNKDSSAIGLKQAGADYIASTPQELIDFFKKPYVSVNQESISVPSPESGNEGHGINLMRSGIQGTSERLIRTFEGHSSIVLSVAFSPNSKYIISGGSSNLKTDESENNTLMLWEVKSGNLVYTIENHAGDSVRSAAFSPNGKYIISGATGTTVANLQLWDTGTGCFIKSFGGIKDFLIGHQCNVLSIAISPDSKRIVAGVNYKVFKLWDIEKGRLIRNMGSGSKKHTDSVLSVAYSSDNKCIASGSKDKTLKLWKAEKGQLIRTFEGHTGDVHSVAFSPDNKYIVSGSADKTLKLWDVESGQLIHTFEGHTDIVKSVAFSPDNKRIVSGASDKTLKLWDTESGQLIHIFASHTNIVHSVAFSPNNKYIASGSWDKTIKLWEA